MSNLSSPPCPTVVCFRNGWTTASLCVPLFTVPWCRDPASTLFSQSRCPHIWHQQWLKSLPTGAVDRLYKKSQGSLGIKCVLKGLTNSLYPSHAYIFRSFWGGTSVSSMRIMRNSMFLNGGIWECRGAKRYELFGLVKTDSSYWSYFEFATRLECSPSFVANCSFNAVTIVFGDFVEPVK